MAPSRARCEPRYPRSLPVVHAGARGFHPIIVAAPLFERPSGTGGLRTRFVELSGCNDRSDHARFAAALAHFSERSRADTRSRAASERHAAIKITTQLVTPTSTIHSTSRSGGHCRSWPPEITQATRKGPPNARSVIAPKRIHALRRLSRGGRDMISLPPRMRAPRSGPRKPPSMRSGVARSPQLSRVSPSPPGRAEVPSWSAT